ncbi:hypothetical protein V8C86DRAFT_2580303 [Haematococcus lacustris]
MGSSHMLLLLQLVLRSWLQQGACQVSTGLRLCLQPATAYLPTLAPAEPTPALPGPSPPGPMPVPPAKPPAVVPARPDVRSGPGPPGK